MIVRHLRDIVRRVFRDKRGSSDLNTYLLLSAAGCSMVVLTAPHLFNSSKTASDAFDKQVQVLERGASPGGGSSSGGIGDMLSGGGSSSGFDMGGGGGGGGISGPSSGNQVLSGASQLASAGGSLTSGSGGGGSSSNKAPAAPAGVATAIAGK